MPWLRALAAVVALLVAASSLSQAAHFLLVQHVVCAEHGELLEVGEGSGHGASSAHGANAHAADEHEPGASRDDLSAEHEHCQILARGQREQALPAAPVAGLEPAIAAIRATPAPTVSELREQRPPLSLAPKTSPPNRLSC